MKTTVFLFTSFLLLTASCKKVRVCECKTTWTEQTQWGPVDREETTAQPFKDTKANVKKECDAFRINLDATYPEGYYTSCAVK